MLDILHPIAGKFYPVYDKYQSTIGKPTSDITNYSGSQVDEVYIKA